MSRQMIRCIAFFLFGPWVAFAGAVQDNEETVSTEKGLASLKNETAGALLSFARTMTDEGRFDLAAKALKSAGILDPASAALDSARLRLTERKLTFPATASPYDMKDKAKPLYRSEKESLSGWKAFRGRWESQKDGMFCDSGGRDAFIYRSSKGPDRFGLSFRFMVSGENGKAGVVLGSAGRGKPGILFDADGMQLWDFKASKPLGGKVKARLKPIKAHSVDLVLRNDAVVVVVDGKTTLSGRIQELDPDRTGFYAAGKVLFSDPMLSGLEEDILVEMAEKESKRRNHLEAVPFLLRAREVNNRNAKVLAMLGEALSVLKFEDESVRCYEAFLTLPPVSTTGDRILKRSETAARDSIALAKKSTDLLEAELQVFVESVEAFVCSAIENNDTKEAEAAVQALEALDVHAGRTAELKTRLFVVARGGEKDGEKVLLYNGEDLGGWTKRHGEWSVKEEGAIEASCGLDGAAVLAADPLPRFERFLISTRQKGTGAYIDQGIRLKAGKDSYDFHLYKPMVGYSTMVGKKVTVEKNGSAVLFKGMQGKGLTASDWYEVELLVDMNLVTYLFEGEALFTKVMSGPVETEVALYVTAGRQGFFDSVAITPFGSEERYLSFLDEKGLDKRCVIECEAAEQAGSGSGKGRVREQPFAYNGRSLAGALDAKEPVAYRFKSLNMDSAVLSLRYSAPGDKYSGSQSRTRIALTLDSVPVVEELCLLSTGDSRSFKYCKAALGNLTRGWHELGLLLIEGGKGILLDRIEITGPDSVPEGEVRLVSSGELDNFKIRLSPGIVLPGDVDEIFSLLEVMRSYMVDYYGFEPSNPLFFNLIARECWADPHKGGYAGGDNLYIPDDITFSNIATIMHEMSHCFDYKQGYNPPWFGEGKSFPCYDRFVDETHGRYRRFQQPFVRSNVRKGKQSFEALEYKGENLFQFWGTEKFPYWGKTPDGRDLTHQGYAAANWFCNELSRFLGPSWLKDYFALLRRDIEAGCFFMPKDRIRANSVIVDYFNRSSGKDATGFFEDKRFILEDFYGGGSLEIDCGVNDADYLTENEGACLKDVPGMGGEGEGDGAGKAWFIEEGGITYVVPLSPDTVELTIEVTKKGRGRCEAEGELLFRGGIGGRHETKLCRLDDPALWQDARLVLRFDAEQGAANDGFYLEKIVLSW